MEEVYMIPCERLPIIAYSWRLPKQESEAPFQDM